MSEEITGIQLNKIHILELSEWKCYMFGNTPSGTGLVYQPQEGHEPNRFVRWMMRICFACTWVKEEHNA